MNSRKAPTIRDIMTRRLVTLTPELTLAQASEALMRSKVSGAPVVDARGHLVGVLTEFDCLEGFVTAAYEHAGHDTVDVVGDRMSPDPWTVSPSDDVLTVAMAFVQRHVRRFPVVEDGRLVGLVSRRDVLKAAQTFGDTAARPQYPDYPEGRTPLEDARRH